MARRSLVVVGVLLALAGAGTGMAPLGVGNPLEADSVAWQCGSGWYQSPKKARFLAAIEGLQSLPTYTGNAYPYYVVDCDAKRRLFGRIGLFLGAAGVLTLLTAALVRGGSAGEP